MLIASPATCRVPISSCRVYRTVPRRCVLVWVHWWQAKNRLASTGLLALRPSSAGLRGLAMGSTGGIAPVLMLSGSGSGCRSTTSCRRLLAVAAPCDAVTRRLSATARTNLSSRATWRTGGRRPVPRPCRRCPAQQPARCGGFQRSAFSCRGPTGGRVAEVDRARRATPRCAQPHPGTVDRSTTFHSARAGSRGAGRRWA